MNFGDAPSTERPFPLLVGHAYEAELGAPYVMWVRSAGRIEYSSLAAPTGWTAARLATAARPTGAGHSCAALADVDISTAENHLRFMQGIVQTLIHLAQDAPVASLF